jgi:hemerythrin
MKIEWQSRYETGLAEVDDDHRRLVSLINDLDAVLDGTDDLRQIGVVIDALVDYADYHFSREEEMMARAGYEETQDHGLVHAQFGQFLGELVGGCMLDPSREAAAKVRDYLQEWLLEHILVEDMKFVPIVKAMA